VAILTGFLRADRKDEIAGCPLNDGGDESACARCRYNALDPGRARVGCSVQTPVAELGQALTRLHQIDPAAHARFVAILEAQQRRPEGQGLYRDELDTLTSIAARWAPLVGNDAGEQHVVALVQRFCAAAKASGEALRILA
jgi:hypothetical protein